MELIFKFSSCRFFIFIDHWHAGYGLSGDGESTTSSMQLSEYAGSCIFTATGEPPFAGRWYRHFESSVMVLEEKGEQCECENRRSAELLIVGGCNEGQFALPGRDCSITLFFFIFIFFVSQCLIIIIVQLY